VYVVIVDIQIKPERREAFLEEMIRNATSSLRDEPGCVRFDVVQDEADPDHLILYEIYRDRASFDDHLKTAHFLRWRDAVRDWHARPAQSWKGTNLHPRGDAIAG
jgi:autoinducer 2-degrading protein